MKHIFALQAVAVAFLLGVLPQDAAVAQTVSGSSPAFTVNTLAADTPVLSIVASTNVVAGRYDLWPGYADGDVGFRAALPPRSMRCAGQMCSVVPCPASGADRRERPNEH